MTFLGVIFWGSRIIHPGLTHPSQLAAGQLANNIQGIPKPFNKKDPGFALRYNLFGGRQMQMKHNNRSLTHPPAYDMPSTLKDWQKGRNKLSESLTPIC